MRFQRNLKPFAGRVDLAPFAGMLFLIVLFLLLQTSIAPQPGLRVQLPSVPLPDRPAGAGASLVVTVDRNETVYFDHQVIRDEELRDRLTAKCSRSREPIALLIQADESVRHAAIVRLAALARQAGVREVVIGTRPPLFPPGSEPAGKP